MRSPDRERIFCDRPLRISGGGGNGLPQRPAADEKVGGGHNGRSSWLYVQGKNALYKCHARYGRSYSSLPSGRTGSFGRLTKNRRTKETAAKPRKTAKEEKYPPELSSSAERIVGPMSEATIRLQEAMP